MKKALAVIFAEGDRVWMTCTCGAVITGTLIVTDSVGPQLVRVVVLVRVAAFG